MADLRFDGRVVVLTGAGNGLGKAHAKLFASRGAKVVVNDLGGDIHGGGGSARAADVVVSEIEEAGGEAVANYDSVEDGDKIIQTALDTYGRVDVVVNNAGILRDVSFHKMTEDDWEKIYRVHVHGSFKVTHAAWPHMREQGYGRVVMTASAAGIYGNFGQANYGMAKLGLFGFANTLAIEGRKKGIVVNTVAPLAGSRLTETVLPPNLIEALRPEYVSPLVAYLCHESCHDTGGLYEVGGGFFGKLRFERAKGKLLRLGREMRIEDIEKSWKQITGFEDRTVPTDIMQSMAPIMENIEAGPSKGGNDLIDVDQALGFEYPETTSTYDERDLAIYALGVGASADPLDEAELRYVYEMHRDGFVAVPTYGVIPAINGILAMAKEGTMAPGLNYGLERLLHGEQKMTLHRPLPPKAKLTHESRITDIFDKGKGALIVTETKSFDDEGELLITNVFTAFIKGAGGWGGDPGPKEKKHVAPDREPDAVKEQKIEPNQALLYRLSGDWNPLHADPGFAKAFGFERPILHGLCTMGYAARHVLAHFAEGDPRLFESIDVRFSKTVFPGETLVTEMWKEKDEIVFVAKVKERDEVVLQNAAITLYDAVPEKQPKPKSEAKTSKESPSVPISADIFNAIGVHLQQNPETVESVGKVFQFELTSPNSTWTIDAKSGSVARGGRDKPDCTLTLSDDDFMAMCTGKADPQKLYFGGQLQIGGDVMASQKLSFLQKLDPSLVTDQMARRGEGGAEGPSGPRSGDVFLGIKAYVAEHPELVKDVGKVYLFRLTDPASVWTLDLKSEAGAVGPGELGKPDCTLEISEDDFMNMTSGKADAQKLYFGGQLKIGGDVMASQKLTFLSKIDPDWAKQKVAELKARGETMAASTEPAGSPREPSGPRVKAAIEKALANNPSLREEVKAVVALRLTEPDHSYTLDIQKGEVRDGLSGEPAVTLTMSDEDLETLCSGGDLRLLYQRGRIRIDGDVAATHRLGFMSKLLA